MAFGKVKREFSKTTLVFIFFVVACALFGGSSRADAWSGIILKPVVVLTLTIMLLNESSEQVKVRSLFLILALFAGTMLIQLVPLPRDVWLGLAGHGAYQQTWALANIGSNWVAISLTPDLTLNSAVALLPAAVVLSAYRVMPARERAWLVGVLAGIAALSCVVGLLQIAGGPDSAFYFYRPTSDTLPVGLFANRNHQAVLLAAAIPAIALWATMPARTSSQLRFRYFSGAGLGLLCMTTILVTGSRAGMMCAAVALLVSGCLLWSHIPASRRRARIGVVLVVLVPVLVVLAAVLAGRALSIDRLMEDGQSAHLRVAATPVVLAITRTFLPWGAGFGSFDQVFRASEPDALLKATYFNRAHNDVLETILSGGIPAALVLVLFGAWWLRQTVVIVRRAVHGQQRERLAILGVCVTAIYGFASFVDYPLRSPLSTVVFALACCWMLETGDARSPGSRSAA